MIEFRQLELHFSIFARAESSFTRWCGKLVFFAGARSEARHFAGQWPHGP